MMVKQHSFEIKVALIGNVSGGKTTVLNALFKDKYSEVSMKRTTAGVNYFRVSVGKSAEETSEVSNGSENEAMEWSDIADDPRTPESTLGEIKADNVALRESNEVHEKHFDIELNKDLVEMRKDTKLVVVDVPGVNEAGASRKYREYVKDKWNTFDCVVVVMDAKQGVNTEEQVELLNDVKENLQSKKNLPVIILCNKVDDPEDEEQAELVREARVKVQEVFGVGDRSKALKVILNRLKKVKESNWGGAVFPCFIPLSAVNAFIYQSAHQMTLEQFQRFDKELIEKLGKEQIGKRLWNRMSYPEKVKKTYELVIKDPEQYQEGLEASNFDKFLAVLSFGVGGVETQSKLIEKQIVVAMGSISLDTPCLTTELKDLHRKQLHMLGEPTLACKNFTNGLFQKFKIVYQHCEDSAFQRFDMPGNVEILARPMLQLITYHDWASENGWDDEVHFAAGRMEQLVRRQISVLLEVEAETNKEYALERLQVFESPSWQQLSVFDWNAILGSIRLLAYDKNFCQLFGEEKIFLDDRVVEASNEAARAFVDWNRLCPGCKNVTVADRCDGCRVVYTSQQPTVGQSCSRCNSDYYKLSDNGDGKLKCNYCGYTHVKRVYFDEMVKTARKRKLVDGKFVPIDPDNYKKVVHYEIPQSLSDPKHFGHLAWLLFEHLAKQ